MNKEVASLILWTGLFLLFELPAHFLGEKCPWYTLSRTVWQGEQWWRPVAIFVLGFTLILLGHLELHWSAKWLIAFAVAGACAFLSRALEHVI